MGPTIVLFCVLDLVWLGVCGYMLVRPTFSCPRAHVSCHRIAAAHFQAKVNTHATIRLH